MKLGFYFDIVGNHDAYGDDGLSFYLANSLWGSNQHKTWMDFTVTTKLGEYRFFGMNSTNNYFKPLSNCCPGFLDSEIAELDAWLQKNADAKLVFVAAHHAFDGNGSQPTANADKVRALLKTHKGFYLHGDMHELKEYLDSGEIVVNEIGSLGKGDTNNIGIGVVDHDAFIYHSTDVSAAWPVAIVTTPVSMNLRDVGANPYAYSVCKDRKDNPFRALSFSYTPPSKVALKVGALPEVAMKPAKGTFDFSFPVWEAELDTQSLSAGPTTVSVRVEADGKTNTHEITANFAPGPCGPLPSGVPEPTPDAGPDADPGDAGPPPTEAGPVADTGVGNPDQPTVEASAGCSCRTPADDGRSAQVAPLLAGGVALAFVRLRRRGSRAAR
jgi:MYXO-CTERM domain-containing protein